MFYAQLALLVIFILGTFDRFFVVACGRSTPPGGAWGFLPACASRALLFWLFMKAGVFSTFPH